MFYRTTCREDGDSFSSKDKIEGMSFIFAENIPEQPMKKELLQNFHKIEICGKVCILKIARMYLFKTASKAHVLLF